MLINSVKNNYDYNYFEHEEAISIRKFYHLIFLGSIKIYQKGPQQK